MIQDRTADGGYPIDSDLHNMTDDGCPLFPDPARWDDADWRDNLGELDTFDGPTVGPNVPAELALQPRPPTPTHRTRLLRCRVCGWMEPRSPEELLLLYGTSGYPKCCDRVMDYYAPFSPADAILPPSIAA